MHTHSPSRSLRRAAAALLVAGIAVSTMFAAPASASHSPRVVHLDLRHQWSCESVAVFVDPAAPPSVHEAVRQWHRLFRPDWTFTTDPAAAAVEVWMRRPTYPGAVGYASWWVAAAQRTRSVVEIDPNPKLNHGAIARHELGHVAGLEHNTTTQWSAMHAHPLLDRYHTTDVMALGAAWAKCRRPGMRG